ncbi:MAG: cation:proton antiporter [Myxococcales bacterium]|nr:cation:proton antiporter [Myxococcales bacterium]
MHGVTFVADLAVVLGVAALTGVLAGGLRQPTVLGYLAAGLIVGPYVPIPVFADPERVASLAEFGVVLVMFAIGLEFRVAKLVKVLPTSGLTGLVQISFLAWAGFTLGGLLGWSTVEAVFLGGCLCISSTMLVSKVFAQQPVEADVRDHVLGVLVIQDVAAIALIAAMTGVAAGGGLQPAELAVTLLRLAGVLLGLLVGGILLVPPLMRRVVGLGSAEILAVTAVGLCFGMALLAEHLGYSVALGAFIAGIVVAESGEGQTVEHLLAPLRDVFAALFFVSIGMGVDPGEAWANLGTSLVVAAAVVVAQLVSVSGAGVLSGLGQRRSVIAGLALGQIGEFAFIIAAIGVGAGVVRPSLQPVVVTVAVLTAFTTPFLLKRAGAFAAALDHHTPHRIQRLLCLYEAWLQRARASVPDAAQVSARRRALRSVALDAAGLVLAGALLVVWLPDLARGLADRLSTTERVSGALIVLGTMLALSPLAAGLWRNGDLLARLLASRVAPEGENATAGERAAAGALRATTHLMLVVVLGAPAIAIMRPITGGPYGVVVLTIGLLASAALVWRAAGRVELETRSGTGQLVARLAARAAPIDAPPVDHAPPAPAVGALHPVALRPGDAAVGRTLADLDLRALTGATVVSIRRGGDAVVLPGGKEALGAGDVLELTGTGDALSRAEAALRGAT